MIEFKKSQDIIDLSQKGNIASVIFYTYVLNQNDELRRLYTYIHTSYSKLLKLKAEILCVDKLFYRVFFIISTKN